MIAHWESPNRIVMRHSAGQDIHIEASHLGGFNISPRLTCEEIEINRMAFYFNWVLSRVNYRRVLAVADALERLQHVRISVSGRLCKIRERAPYLVSDLAWQLNLRRTE